MKTVFVVETWTIRNMYDVALDDYVVFGSIESAEVNYPSLLVRGINAGSSFEKEFDRQISVNGSCFVLQENKVK